MVCIMVAANMAAQQAPSAQPTPAPPKEHFLSDELNNELPKWLHFSGGYRARVEGFTGGAFKPDNEDAYYLLVKNYAWTVLLQDTGVINTFLLRWGVIQKPLHLMYNLFGVLVGMIQMLLPFMLREWRWLCVIAGLTALSCLTGALQPWPMKLLVDHAIGGRPLPGDRLRRMADALVHRGDDQVLQIPLKVEGFAHVEVGYGE